MCWLDLNAHCAKIGETLLHSAPMRRASERILSVTAIGFGAVCLLGAGCETTLYDPALATRPYPDALVQDRVVQIQAIPRELDLELVNATMVDYTDVDIWVNRRFVQHLGALRAGQTVRMPIDHFRDVWGQCPQPGGFWRTRHPTPLIVVQIQRGETTPLVGLVTVVPEAARY